MESEKQESSSQDPLTYLPRDLRKQATANPDIGELLAAAPYDLDEHGQYRENYLLLTRTSLGHFAHDGKSWVGEWIALAGISDALIVDGLGMKLLRLIGDDRVIAQFRFTLKHARPVGAFHRKLEALVGDAEESEALHEPTKSLLGEKKIRCEKCDELIPNWASYCPACMSRRQILWRLLDYVKPYKTRALAALMLSIVLTSLAMINPFLVKPLANRGFGASPAYDPDGTYVVGIVGIMFGLLLLNCLGHMFQARLSMGLGAIVCRDLRSAVYNHLHSLSLTFFSQRQTGSLVTRITTDTARLLDFMSNMFISIVLSMLTVVGVGVCLFVMHWKLALFAIAPIPLMFIVMALFHKRMRPRFRRIWHRWSQMTAVVAGALPGVRVVKAFGQEDREVQKFEQKSNAVCQEELEQIYKNRSMFVPAMILTGTLGSLIVWMVGGLWIARGDPANPMDLGTLMAFQAYLAMFMRPIHQIAHMDVMLNRAATSAHRIFEILDTPPSIYTRSGAHRPDTVEGKIEFRNVSFSYDGVQKVLNNVSFTIEAGQMIGLAGPSGAGKSTIVNLVCRLYDVLEGSILVDDVDVRDYDLFTLRRKIGMVLQEPFLFHGTVAENIAYGNPDANVDQIIAAARAANANDFILGFPDGYDTLVGERGQTLSGGERQRISIARAILNDPEILILDEATSSVDTETEELIQQALEKLTSQRTTIAIAHRLSTLRRANKLVIIDNGIVAEQGHHSELETLEGGLYARLLSKQKSLQSTIALTA